MNDIQGTILQTESAGPGSRAIVVVEMDHDSWTHLLAASGGQPIGKNAVVSVAPKTDLETGYVQRCEVCHGTYIYVRRCKVCHVTYISLGTLADSDFCPKCRPS